MHRRVAGDARTCAVMEERLTLRTGSTAPSRRTRRSSGQHGTAGIFLKSICHVQANARATPSHTASYAGGPRMRGVMASIPVDARVNGMRGESGLKASLCLSTCASAPAVHARQERHALCSSGSEFLRLLSLKSRAFPRPLNALSCSRSNATSQRIAELFALKMFACHTTNGVTAFDACRAVRRWFRGPRRMCRVPTRTRSHRV